ncbi:MAG TPA: MerR family transcriptional regulator [Chloroflexia bacterium]|jgi:DNA-binding transcriptional MerR regulator
MNTNLTKEERLQHSGEEEALLRIGDVAELTGLTQRTIRYYEEVGLLMPPTRTEGDFRLYSRRDVMRLAEIVRLKNLLGFSLGEIRKIVEGEETRTQLRNEYRATEDAAVRFSKLHQALEVAQSQLGLVTNKIVQMQELRDELESRIACYERMKLELLDLQESKAENVGAATGGGRSR